MDTYGLIGYPLVHSFSRQFFTDKFAKEGTKAQYLNFELSSINQLYDVISSHPELKGLNVTIPYKELVIPFLDEISEEAEAIGAVNVIHIKRYGHEAWLKGYNADVTGFMASIRPLLGPTHHKALVLGTGGASKAVCYGLEEMGVFTRLVSRHPDDDMLGYGDITDKVIREYPVIVNCTPCGMFPHIEECPRLPYEALTEDNVLFDLIYNPDETLFLRQGREHGAVVKNGLEMLHLQALASWDIWNSHTEKGPI